MSPPYFLENKPTGSVTIPWNADYIVTLAGGAGSSSTGRQGGNGYVVSAKLRLEKGTVLSWTTGGKGAIAKAGTTSRGGGQSTLSINGTVVWVAGGGVGATPAYNETARTVTECSMAIAGGESGGRDGYVQYHTCSNSPSAPCYSQVPHTHTSSCPSHQCGKPVGGVGADGHGGACPDGHPNVGFQGELAIVTLVSLIVVGSGILHTRVAGTQGRLLQFQTLRPVAALVTSRRNPYQTVVLGIAV